VVREFHLDGLRLDATQAIHDASRPHVITELSPRRAAHRPDRRERTAQNDRVDRGSYVQGARGRD
jgi:maltooligosyltrehalose trehalohydrolase